MTQVSLSHATTYRYSAPASLGPQLIRLAPAPHTRASIARYDLVLGPMEHSLTWQRDPFGNRVARMTTFALPEELRVDVSLVAVLEPINPFDFVVDADAAAYPFAYSEGLAGDLAPFLAREAGGARFDALVAAFAGPAPDIVQRLIDLNAAVRAAVAYTERLQPGTQAPEETLSRGSGSCRDSAWLLVQALRALGIAARFVSGYSIQLADGAEVAADGADLHAWGEAYLPGAGWIGLDPVSGLLTGEGHIPLAATARLAAAAPIEGAVYGDVTATMDFAVTVRRLD